MISSPAVEGPTDHIHLLLPGETDEVDRVSRNTNCQLRVLVWMLHRVEQRIAIENIQVHVEPALAAIRVHDLHGLFELVALVQTIGPGDTDTV